MNLITAFALFAFAFASVNAAGCAYLDPTSGCQYNLDSLSVPLNSPASAFYNFTVATGPAAGMYNWNICNALNSTEIPCGAGTEVAVCQSTGNNSYSAGVTGTESWAAYNGLNMTSCPGVSLTYGGGDDCVVIGTARQTTISVACNPAALTPRTVNVTEDSCQYLITMESAAACGTLAPSLTPTATPTVTATMSMSMMNTTGMNSTSTATVTATMTATPTMTATMSMSMMNTTGMNSTTTVTVSMTPSMTASLSTGASVSPSPSVGSPAADEGSSGGNTWIWWVVGGIAIVVIVAAIAAAGFVVYKKKQQSYDSIGYE